MLLSLYIWIEEVLQSINFHVRKWNFPCEITDIWKKATAVGTNIGTSINTTPVVPLTSVKVNCLQAVWKHLHHSENVTAMKGESHKKGWKRNYTYWLMIK